MQAALTSPRLRRRAALTLLAVILALAALWLATHIPHTLSVFVVAAFVAAGVSPVVVRLERFLPRAGAIAVVYAGLLAVGVLLAFLVVPALLAQVQILATAAPSSVDGLQQRIDAAQRFLRLHFLRGSFAPGAGDLHSIVASRTSLAVTTVLASLTDILVRAFTAAFVGISALVLSAFFVYRGERLVDGVYQFLPEKRRATARALVIELAEVFGSFVSGQVALCAITGALIFGLTAATGFKFALLLAIVAGLAYAVPFVGMIVAHVVALVLAAPEGTQMVLWVQAIVFVVARVVDNVFVPKVMADSVGVSPVVVMFAVFAGGELFGLPGLLLGIPIAALTKVAWSFYRRNDPYETPLPEEAVPSDAPSAAAAPGLALEIPAARL